MSVTAKRPPGIRANGKPRKDLARKAVQLDYKPGATQDDVRRELATLATSPELTAYRVVLAAERKSRLGDSLDVPALLEVLRSQAAAAKCNDLAQAEAMLMNQATALQTLFGRLAERGMGCDQAPAFEANFRMALRAQAQCRATLETLAMIKNPAPVAFVRQANIAAGPQQVNNGPQPGEGSRARENEMTPNKLLEAQDGERLDARTTSKASAADPALEAVGAVDRAEDASR
jgi:hypothetical protein